MRRLALNLTIGILAAIPGGVFARRPVLVELFTAQGCASCSKSNILIGETADRPGVVALTWSVDYWDYLGWKDSFARPEFTDRQRRYEQRFHLRDVYTPQVVIDGQTQISGDKPAMIDSLIDKARRDRGRAPDMKWLAKGRVAIGSGPPPPGGADVWFVRFDPRDQTIEVKAGDNRGARVSHRNVVRQLVRLGRWNGRPLVFAEPPAQEDGLMSLVLVQKAHAGAILGLLRGANPPS